MSLIAITIQSQVRSLPPFLVCDGKVNGAIFGDGVYYEILFDNEREQHQLRDSETKTEGICGTSDHYDREKYHQIIKQIERQKVEPTTSVKNKQAIIELCIVNDKQLLTKFFRDDIESLEAYDIQLVNIISALYYPLNIGVQLSNIVIWSEKDPISPQINITEHLTVFNKYVIKNEYKKGANYDVVMLLTGHILDRRQGLDFTLGIAYKDTVCTEHASGVVHFQP
ncbi:Zinc metalloproteinase/disintegrin [Halotydeus destructor]|nr:Zinc metalloproteinase/disintegrin [Halotydeus destructor]